jgi:hypothetical protein
LGVRAGVVNDGSGPEVPDQLDMMPEVRRFAHLVLDRELRPPIAIGLLGEWGSGRSFFLERLRQEVRRVAAREGSAERHVRNVCDVSFNAWHFVDTNLWASLAAEIFTGLDVWVRRSHTLPLHLRRERAGEALIEAKTAEEAAEEALRLARRREEEVRADAVAARRREEQRLREVGSLFDPDVARAVLDTESGRQTRDRLNKALSDIGLAEIPDELLGQVAFGEDIRVRARSGAVLLSAMGRSLFAWDPLKWAMICILFALSVVPEHPWFKGFDAHVPQVFVGVGAILRQVQSAFSRVRTVVEQGFSLERQAVAARDGVLLRRMEAREVEAAAETARLRAAEEALQAARARSKQAEDTLSDLQPRQLLATLSAAAAAEGGRYRQEEGIIAAIRRDLSSLEQILREDPENLDRVVLYIDDLDRCPPDKIVEVLQAVHLLLAFELFVVVVAADPATLERALVQHHQGGGGLDGRTEAIHWLEKVFQIPYRVGRLSRRGFENIVDSLSAPTVQAVEEANTIELPPLDPALRFTLSPAELSFIRGLHGFVRTPRCARRLFNTYYLLRAGVPEAELPAFVAEEHRVTLTLLALAVSWSTGGARLLRAVAAGQEPLEVLRAPEALAEPGGAELAAVFTALRPALSPPGPVWPRMAERVARFTFWGLEG